MRAIGRGRIAVGVATALLIVLPLAGAAGGVYVVVPSNPPMQCGLWVLPAIMVSITAGVLGFVAGVGTAWLMARGLFRWANGCGLAEVGDDSDIL